MPFVKRKKRPEISSPTNFEHRVHSGYDHNTGVFVNLPTQWTSIINDTEQQKMLQQQLINNTRLASTRPKPIVDPSRITPNELNVFKTIVRGGGVGGGSGGSSASTSSTESSNGSQSQQHQPQPIWQPQQHQSPIKQQQQIIMSSNTSPTKPPPINGVSYTNGHKFGPATNGYNGVQYSQNNGNNGTPQQYPQQQQQQQQMKHHHLNAILPLVESALCVTEKKSIGLQVSFVDF